jgi:CoA:oxalate CoA-transferase
MAKRTLTVMLPLLDLDDPSVSDPNWQPPQNQAEHFNALRDRIRAAIRGWKSSDLLAALHEAGVPATMATYLEEAMLGEQATANGFVYTADHPAVGPMTMPSAPVQFSRDRYEAADRSPAFGEHLRDILGELGHSEEQIARYIASGAVAEELPDPDRVW